MADQAVEVVFDPHVSIALSCLMFALVILGGLATKMLADWLGWK